MARLQESTTDPHGEISGLLGLAYFYLENYSESETQFETALAHHTENPEWEDEEGSNFFGELDAATHIYDDEDILLLWGEEF